MLDVVGVGDVARFPIRAYGFGTVRIEHWNDADRHRRARGGAACSPGSTGPVTPRRRSLPLPTFWSDQWGVRLQSCGLPHLGLADVRVLEGDINGECVVGYHDETGRLVGVVLFGLTRELLTYRTRIATERPTHTDAAATLSTAR